jgi:hypothetical protein
VRRFTCAKNHLVGFELFLFCVTRQQFEVMRAHSGEKRVSGNLFQDILVVVGEIAGLAFGFHTLHNHLNPNQTTARQLAIDVRFLPRERRTGARNGQRMTITAEPGLSGSGKIQS